MLYIRKAIPLHPIQLLSDLSRESVCISVAVGARKRALVYNIYNAPGGSEDAGSGLESLLSISTATHPHLRPCLVVGDFNVRHADWDNTTDATPSSGARLLAWSQQNGLSLLNPDNTSTHNRGGTLDLSFSSVPLASCVIANDLHTGSDHESLLTALPLELPPATERGRFRYASCDEPRFLALLQPHGSPLYGDPEHEAKDIMQVLKLALAASCPRATGSTHGKDFWDGSCARAHRQWLAARREDRPGRRRTSVLQDDRTASQAGLLETTGGKHPKYV